MQGFVFCFQEGFCLFICSWYSTFIFSVLVRMVIMMSRLKYLLFTIRRSLSLKVVQIRFSSFCLLGVVCRCVRRRGLFWSGVFVVGGGCMGLRRFSCCTFCVNSQTALLFEFSFFESLSFISGFFRALAQYGQFFGLQVSVFVWGLGRGQGTFRFDRRLGDRFRFAGEGKVGLVVQRLYFGIQDLWLCGGFCGVYGVYIWVYLCIFLLFIYIWVYMYIFRNIYIQLSIYVYIFGYMYIWVYVYIIWVRLRVFCIGVFCLYVGIVI